MDHVARLLGLVEGSEKSGRLPRRGTWCTTCHEAVSPHGPPYCPRCVDVLRQTGKQGPIEEVQKTVPEGYRSLRLGASLLLERLKNPTALARAREAGDQWVTFTGRPGMGKTSLAAALFGELLDAALAKGANRQTYREAAFAVWASATELATARAYHPLGSEPPALRLAKLAPVLVLDDLGAENLRDVGLQDVIYDRYTNRRRTLVTTCLTSIECDRRYGAAITRRLFEEAFVVEMNP